VLAEALVVGLFGSAVGLLVGIGVARGLHALLDAFGISLPSGALVIAPTTVVVSFLGGTGVTLVAATTPAVRSLRVPPVAALQSVAAPPPPRYGNLRYVAGVVVFAGGIVLLVGGLFAGRGIAVVGAGAAVTLLGAALLAPLATRPLLAVLGAPVSSGRGVPGQLATENALRNPRRTAATASALMIGLAMVALISILGASVNRSAEVSIDEVFLSEFQVNPANLFGPPSQGGFPEQLADELAALEEVAVVAPVWFGQFRSEPGGGNAFLAAFDPERIERTLALTYEDGGSDQLARGGIAVSDRAASRDDLAVGDQVTVEFAATGVQQLTVRGIFDRASLDSDWAVDDATYREHFTDPVVAAMYVKLVDGVDAGAARPRLERVLADYPTVQLQDLDEVKQDIREAVNQLLGLVTALLLLSVLIALFGIVNTLGLAVFERTRELGLLRAVGASRGQLRSMIRWESVLIALLGTVFGLVIGVLFAWMVVQALADEGISQFVVPGNQLVLGAVLAAIAGVLAAIVPARRAARIDILRSLEAT
jgi:putative ABC transport system permease protein